VEGGDVVQRRAGVPNLLVPLDFPRIVGVVRQGDYMVVVRKQLERGCMVILLRDGRVNGFTDQIIVPEEEERR